MSGDKETARRYGRALFEVIGEETAVERSVRALTASPRLWQALLDPRVSPAEKKAVVARAAELFSLPFPRELENFYGLLIDKGRLYLLPEIRREYHRAALEAKNAAEALLVCARLPDQALLERIRQALCRLHHKTSVELEVRQDPGLIGGFILEIGGVIYDNSVRGRLEALGRRLQER